MAAKRSLVGINLSQLSQRSCRSVLHFQCKMKHLVLAVSEVLSGLSAGGIVPSNLLQ